MIRILIADDHAIVRNGLKQIIEKKGGNMRVVGEAINGDDVLCKIRQIICDVVLLDIGMSGIGILEILKQIHVINPKLHILIFSNFPEEQYAIHLFKAGVAGYLTKETAPDSIIRAIRRVMSGERHISHEVTRNLVKEAGKPGGAVMHEHLSSREYQVFLLLSSAKTVTDIAGMLSLSVKTVSTYRSRILEKMHLHSNAELIRYAIEQQLVP